MLKLKVANPTVVDKPVARSLLITAFMKWEGTVVRAVVQKHSDSHL